MKEMFLLMTPAQFYEDEEKEACLKQNIERILVRVTVQLIMKFTPERDYKSQDIMFAPEFKSSTICQDITMSS